MEILSLIINTVFYLIVGTLAFVSFLGIYILIKYGRTPVISFFVAISYASVFFLSFIGAFFTLQRLL